MDTVNQKLAKRLKDLRLKHKITQEQLAEAVKTSYKYVQRIEGKNPPDLRISSLERFAMALRIKPSKLIDF